MKTMASKRKEKEPEKPHSSRFLSRKHEKHFKVVQDRRLLMERKVGMIPNFAPQFGEQLLGNDWGKLATYPTPANIAVVKEFYANARKIGDYPAENYLGYVRGHAIRYDPDSINNFLDTVWASGLWRSFIMWLPGQKSRYKETKLKQLKLQLWRWMKMMLMMMSDESIKMHIGQLVNKMEGCEKDAKSDVREECKTIVTRSGKVLEERKIAKKEKANESGKETLEWKERVEKEKKREEVDEKEKGKEKEELTSVLCYLAPPLAPFPFGKPIELEFYQNTHPNTTRQFHKHLECIRTSTVIFHPLPFSAS
ncbi:hypothetical protein LR48_Vigan10g142400 [Vigna angularis]|uniref:Putative plant transposon protein domain-containing protein n=1 Tax=Phaseolus angularis TaxID=3914 RepID=A0A0L9VKW8_PHAAN|nr:hypothetical protein LR48_Vigan10g142400 [Vigna angularis]